MMKFNHILILVTQFELAGAQKVALTQARYFHQQGYRVILCFLYDKYNLLTELQSSEPYPVVNLEAKTPGRPKIRNALSILKASWHLYQLLKKEKIQVIETLTHYSNVLGISIAWLARVPVRISSQRNTLDDFPSWFLKLDAILVNSSLVHKMIAVSEHTRRFCLDVEKMNPEKVVTITNGVDLNKFTRQQWSQQYLSDLRSELNLSSDSLVVITVARLHIQKGHKYLVEAAQNVLQEIPQAIFILVGDGELRQDIENEVQSLKLSQSFRLLGVRSDVPKLLAISDVFVLPSLYEGMPNVILEAMAASLPVVATDVEGTLEVVEDGITGFIVPKATSKLLSIAIKKLLRDGDLRYKLGRQGFNRVKSQFSEKRMCQKYEELFQKVFADQDGSQWKV